MVYRGPRRGCLNCKRRKRKCDGAQPACVNCIKRNEICLTFQNALDAVLRDESTKVSEKVQRLQLASTRRKTEAPPLLSTANPSVRVFEAVDFFLQFYANHDRDIQVYNSYYELLAPVLSNTNSGSPLIHATNACSVFMQECWSALLPETDRARKYASTAFKAVRDAIEDPIESLKDETLMAVLLLETYDMLLTGTQSQPRTGRHHAGVLALVAHRGSLNWTSDISRRLLIAVRHEIINEALKNDITIDRNSPIWQDKPSSEPMPHNHAIDLDLLRVDFVNLKTVIEPFLNERFSKATPSLYDEGEEGVLLSRLLSEVLKLDNNLVEWHSSLPESWSPIPVPWQCPESERRLVIYENFACEVYKDIYIASLINVYRATRILVLKWLIALCYLQVHSHSHYSTPYSISSTPESFAMLTLTSLEETAATARTTLQSLADSFCASVPFHLGNKLQADFFEHPHITYPAPPSILHSQRATTAYYQKATASGAWLLIGPLRTLLTATAPSDPISLALSQPPTPAESPFSPTTPGSSSSPSSSPSSSTIPTHPLLLRTGQWPWLTRQMLRIAAIYNIRAGADLGPNAPNKLVLEEVLEAGMRVDGDSGAEQDSPGIDVKRVAAGFDF